MNSIVRLVLAMAVSLGCLAVPSVAQQCCTGNVSTYCTAGTSVQGCLPAISGNGIPSVDSGSGFSISISGMPGDRYGTIFYGFYSFVTPWKPNTGNPSFKCVASPFQRTGILETGGTIGSCDGVLAIDFNAWRSANPGALGAPFAPGQTIRAQGWYRDPAAPGQTNLSDALQFVLCSNSTACSTIAGFVQIQPGTFQMGQVGVAEPVHSVTINYPFWIAAKEVTQAQYLALMGSNPSYFRSNLDLPVEQVTWFNARAYCVELTNRQAALGSVPAGYEYRLPTEAEWEYAARGGTTGSWYFGESIGCPQANFRNGNYCTGQTTVVGSYSPNAWGLYDMHGNVWEWCLDSHAAYSAGNSVNPFISGGPSRVERGGGWYAEANHCRSSHREINVPSYTNYVTGFRVVLGPVLVP